MLFELTKQKISVLVRNESGEMTMQLAAFAGAFAILVALVAAPALDRASKTYAENKALGIDTVITGSIKKENEGKKYTIRKSVLDDQ